MPFKDPEKEREYRKEQSRKRRAAAKLEAMRGGGGPSRPSRGPQGGSKALILAPADDTFRLDVAGLGRQALARRMVGIGLLFLDNVAPHLERNPRDAIALAMAGVEIVNANYPDSLQVDDAGAEPGSVAVVDRDYLMDPEYLELAEQMLSRKVILQKRNEEQ